jgi:hypothetical protein
LAGDRRFGAGPRLHRFGLAKRAGLDATTFNKSKRVSPEGRPRWPSLESLAKILATTGVTPMDFFGYSPPTEAAVKRASMRRLPVMGLREAGHREPFDALGCPKGRS